MTRFDVISDVYILSDRFIVSNSVELSRIQKVRPEILASIRIEVICERRNCASGAGMQRDCKQKDLGIRDSKA
jgi:hypothetical protein